MPEATTITLAAVGDIALSDQYNRSVTQYGPDHPFDKVRSFFQRHDLVCGNLEAPICSPGDTYPDKCSLRADSEYAAGLAGSGIEVLSLANNHILDYREEGFFETVGALEHHGIRHFGAGRNLAEARQPAIFEIRGVRVGFLGYCSVTIDSPFYASSEERGITPLELELVREDIRTLRPEVHVLVLSVHWGIENWSYPSAKQVGLAHRMIELGADLILGHHPHVLQGVEQYKQGHIVYSLGNFLFSEIHWTWQTPDGHRIPSTVAMNKRNRESMIISASLNEGGVVELRPVPCLISANGQPMILADRHGLSRRIERLSRKLDTADYHCFWRRYSSRQLIKERYLSLLWRVIRSEKIRPSQLWAALWRNFVQRG